MSEWMNAQENTVNRNWSRLFLLLGLFLLVAAPVSATEPVDRVLIVKSAHTLTLMNHNRILKTYKVALGTVPVGPKTKKGDHKTPEGDYIINGKNAHSEFHLALHLSYPNTVDRQRAYKLGVSPGGDVEIHGLMPEYAGLGPLHRQHDWTDGCIAVTNDEIEEIWNLVPVGTRVEIRP